MDIGWRRAEEGMRVGYWQDEDADGGTFVLPARIIEQFQKVEDLQSIRDKNKNLMYANLKQWIDAQWRTPAWFREATRHWVHWKSPARFAGLAIKWRANRWRDDEAGFSLIESWRKQDQHLWKWEVNLRDQVQRRRREHYRVFAANMARTYKTLVIHDFDLRDTQRHVAIESDDPEIKQIRWQQKTACCSSLRDCLVAAFKSRGGHVITVEASLVTRTCHLCGYAEPWKRPAELEHRCEGCGRTWDRDVNSTTNMLQRAWAAPLPDKVPEKTSKWGRRGRHKKKAASG
jgi:hypothetical protein